MNPEIMNGKAGGQFGAAPLLGGWIVALENGTPVRRAASEIEIESVIAKAREVDRILGKEGQSEGTSYSKLWLYNRCGCDDVQELAASGRPFNRPSSSLSGPELFHESFAQHQLKQLALLIGHGIKNFLKRLWHCDGVMPPNDSSSATRPTGGLDCNRDVMAGFAAAHG